MDYTQLRGIFLHEFKLGHSAQQAEKSINSASGTGMTNERTIRRLFVKFRSGDTTLQNEPRGHQPTSCSDELLRNTVEAGPRKSVRAIADELGIHHITVSRQLRAIGKVKKLDSRVSH